MSAYQLPAWVWPVALIAVCILSVMRGGSYERLATGGVVMGWALSRMVFQARSEDLQWGVLLIDACVFGLFVWIAMRSRRFWPLFVAAFELLALLTHLGRAMDSGVSGWAYITAERIWSYLVLAALGYAAWTARRGEETIDRDT